MFRMQKITSFLFLTILIASCFLIFIPQTKAQTTPTTIFDSPPITGIPPPFGGYLPIIVIIGVIGFVYVFARKHKKKA